MKILVSGATGLVGSALVEELVRGGHIPCRLVRPSTKTGGGTPGAFDVVWNPETGELGGAGVGPDAVVNLAGAPIAQGRWTKSRKDVLLQSRVDSTRALVHALAKMNIRPRVLVQASAIGYYGNRGDELLTEESAPGDGFLARVAGEWEAEAAKAEALGIRVVLARFGVILAKEGGALPQMMRPFRFGVGGRVGSGRQWMSWITLEDTVRVLCLAIESNTLRGAINVVSPQPVTNLEFTSELARALGRPAIVPVPAFALRLALGEMADELLLGSLRVIPEKLLNSRFEFRSPDLRAALSFATAGA